LEVIGDGPSCVVRLGPGVDGCPLLHPGGLEVHASLVQHLLGMWPVDFARFLAWMFGTFLRPSGGDSGLVLWPRFSATFCGVFRDNRGLSPVKVQKGGEWDA
jgi:hypothetical protein